MPEDSPLGTEEASSRLLSIKRKIDQALSDSGRAPGEVALLAVSKTFPVDRVKAFGQAGQKAFGESYIQEANEKIPQLPSDYVWHYIGHLQTNKAKYAAALFSVIHSLDKLELAAELDKRLDKLDKTIEAYVQVNVSGEESKSGLAPDKLPKFLEELSKFKRIKPLGLMTMPPYDPDPEVSRPHFVRLRELRDKHCPDLKGLSMGMSDDFQVAISEGSTIVRVGTALFGRR
ncbi:MAG: YggS family pyridoxal phosphate-dependent enzyme [Deltaproteobacteria bacterium]|jgi:pyridoxal phosphate enzyme (YggS family)|nr:YggS family pyridoxal phosphate-dependent enzyme [Deltaproteobacteria bacterium]